MAVLTACSVAVEETSDEVLLAVVNDFLKEKSVCSPLALTELDGSLSAGVQGMLGEPIVKVALPQTEGQARAAAFRQMDALVEAGIYRLFDTDVLLLPSEPPKTVAAQVYQLTDEGRKYVYDSRFGDLFCMGDERVKRLMAREDATEKTPKGRYLVHLSYEPEFVMVPWAQALAAAGNQQLANLIRPGQISRTTLVYAEGEWQDSRQYYKLHK